MDLIAAQRLDGSWDCKSGIDTKMGLSADTLAALKPVKVSGDDVWLTLFFVILLRIYFSSENKKWSLVEKKALTWLETKGININDHLSLLPTVQKLLNK